MVTILAILCAFVSVSTDGVSYYYYGYSDGTAKIYNVTFPSGAVLENHKFINNFTFT